MIRSLWHPSRSSFRRGRRLASASVLGIMFLCAPTIPAFAQQAPTAKPDAEVPAKQPADSLDGPPFVSARAWAIADGRTGEILWGDHQAEPLPMASTTKMMTALVVSRIIEHDPQILQHSITFSERADKTIGSTSGVREGEKVVVEDLLYGMMLPSGNDASVAFGEAFGDRFKEPVDEKPLSRFLAEMNRVAGELGLRETHFVNTHGLTAANHRSSAADLAKLAQVMLKQPLLAKVVSTLKHGCTVEDKEGNKRKIVWSNTNRLLAVEGYDGVKTGTTTPAGACLVASGRRGADHLIVVILGATNSDSRYNDARNLFRWGWLHRGDSKSKAPTSSTEPRQTSPRAVPYRGVYDTTTGK